MQVRLKLLLMLIFVLVVLLTLASARPQSEAKKSGKTEKSQKSPLPQKIIGAAGDYVGSETCKDCHEAEFKSFEAGPHSATVKNKDVAQQGCESCHGPGKKHAESGEALETIVRFPKLSAAQASAQCVDCHQGGEHVNFVRSAHMKNNVGCVDCHSAHTPQVKTGLLKASQPGLCFGCHLEAKADFSKPFHHRVKEKVLGCNDCHNPHGGFLQKQLRATAAQDATCFGCHTEKAGPFVFEHAPVKTEGCVSCHTPHGSTNPRLLKRSQVNLLCLECHTFTIDLPAPGIPSFHNQAQKYQSCTSCHVAIHGSNHSSVFFK